MADADSTVPGGLPEPMVVMIQRLEAALSSCMLLSDQVVRRVELGEGASDYELRILDASAKVLRELPRVIDTVFHGGGRNLQRRIELVASVAQLTAQVEIDRRREEAGDPIA